MGGRLRTAKRCLGALVLASLNAADGACDEIPDVGLKDLPGIFAKIEEGGQEEFYLLQFLDAGDKDAVPFLIERLDARNSLARHGAAYALSAIGPEASPAIARLRRSLKDEDEAVRGGAVVALREIGTDKAIPALAEALGMPDPDMERLAREGLVEIGMPAKPTVEAMLKARDLGEETAAALRRTLSEIEENEAARIKLEKGYGFLKSTKRSTRSGPAIGSVPDEGTGCRLWSGQGTEKDGERVVYSEGLMNIDGKDVQLEYIGPRASPFGFARSKPQETNYDYYKGGPFLVLVEYGLLPAKGLYGLDFRAVIHVNRGKETTVVGASGECGS